MTERAYRIHVAAERSGVRVELIRAWERRYGVVVPRRTPSGYRVYTERDVALLRRLKQLTEQGVAIGDAVGMLPQLLAELDAGVSPSPAPAPPEASHWQEAILEAAAEVDPRRVSDTLDRMLAVLPPLRAYAEVLVPLQREVGERWHAGRLSVGQEHLVTHEVRTRLFSLLHSAPQQGSRWAVLACFPEEQHEVGLLGAALRMRHAGFRVTVLGTRTPAAEVGKVARVLRAELVGLSVVMDPGAEAFEATLVAVLGELSPEISVWVGGPVALRYAEVCARLGVRVFENEADWSKLLAG